jgi:hypothetical protein
MNYNAQKEQINTAVAPLLLEPVPIFNREEAGVRSFGGDAVYSARVILGLDHADLNQDYAKSPDIPKDNTVFSDKVKVYPNPANEQINLAFENELSMEAEFELFDFSGKLLLSKTLEAKTVFNTINLIRVKAGIYYYKIYTANETLAKNKLVILNK